MAVLAELDDPVQGHITVVLDERGLANRAEIRFPRGTVTVQEDGWIIALGAAAAIVKRECPTATITFGKGSHYCSYFARFYHAAPIRA